MSDKPQIKVQKKADRRRDVHPDLQRLARSMRKLLRDYYADPSERKNAARQIMKHVQAV